MAEVSDDKIIGYARLHICEDMKELADKLWATHRRGLDWQMRTRLTQTKETIQDLLDHSPSVPDVSTSLAHLNLGIAGVASYFPDQHSSIPSPALPSQTRHTTTARTETRPATARSSRKTRQAQS